MLSFRTIAIAILLFGLVSWTGRAAEDPTGQLFGLTNLWTLRLSFTEPAWAKLQPSGRLREFSHRYPWSTCTVDCAGATLANVAVRFKGNSSFRSVRAGDKFPFRLDFGRSVHDRRLLGVKEVSLNNNFNDATQFREALAYEVCRRAGLPAPRTAFAKVYLTIDGVQSNRYLGLYTLAQPVDKEFLKAHFPEHKGLLLKPERLPGLEYLGTDWRAYTNQYQPKTEAKPAEIQRFITLTQLLAESDDAGLDRELPKQLNLENLFRYVGVMAMLANYDSFVGNGHNYYFFEPAHGGKSVFIPWDLNEAFGGHPMAGPRSTQAEFSVLHPQAGRNRLLDRVLMNADWAKQYRDELNQLLTNACAPARLAQLETELIAVVQESVFEESATARADFQRIALGQTNLTEPRQGFGPRETMPLKDWIQKRLQNVQAELDGRKTARPPRMQRDFFPPFGGPPKGGPGPWGGPPGPPPEDRLPPP